MKPRQITLLGLLTVAFLSTTSVRLTADDTQSLFDRRNISALRWLAVTLVSAGTSQVFDTLTGLAIP